MIDIKNYIKENIFDNPEEIAKKDIKVQPKDKYELQEIIINEIKKYNKLGETVDLNFIDTSKITNMRNLFCDTLVKKFNYKLDEWDVSNVTDMREMFYNCYNFNCDLSKWDVSNVKYMSGMFLCCENFNCDLSKWDVSNVEEMAAMFAFCKNFEGKGLEKWKRYKINRFGNIFIGCDSLKNVPSWYKGKI